MAGEESYAGITVPPGDPDQMEALSATFNGLGAGLESTAMQLRGLPYRLSSWHGPASVAAAAQAEIQAQAAEQGAQAFAHARDAARAYGHELRTAQQRARHAIDDAHDAQRRLDQAKAQIAHAEAQLAGATGRLTEASARVVATGLVGAPSPHAVADQHAAQHDIGHAEAELRQGKQRLQRAQEDLRNAQKRGHDAMRAAADAERQVAGVYAMVNAMVPSLPGLGAPGHGMAGGGGVRVSGLAGPAGAGGHQLAGLDPFGGGSPGFGDLSQALTIGTGGLAGKEMAALHQEYERAQQRVERLAPEHWKGLPLTPEEEITLSRSRALAGRAAQAARLARWNPLKTIGVTSAVLEPLGGYLTFRSNEATGMSTGENVVRTAFSTGFASLGGGVAGSACGGTLVLAPAAPLCGAAGAFVGSLLGNTFGGFAYKVGTGTYHHVFKPAAHGLEQAGHFLKSHVVPHEPKPILWDGNVVPRSLHAPGGGDVA